MRIKLSRTNKILVSILSLILIILSVSTVYVTIKLGSPEINADDQQGFCIYAQPLTEKPITYIAITNPDPYVLKAISNPNYPSYLGNGTTKIVDLLKANNTTNIEYNKNYYKITYGFTIGEPPPPISSTVFLILSVSWMLWGLTAVAYMIIIIMKKKIKD